MANTFDPRNEQDNDLYVFENPKSDLAGKLGSAAIAVTSLVSAFAFLSPSAPTTSNPGSNLSEPAAADPQTTQATGPDSTANNEAAPASQTPSNNTAAASVRPRFVTTGQSTSTKPQTHVVSNPANPSASPSQTPSATPTVDPNAAIGGVAAGNTSSSTAAAGAGSTASGTTAGNTSSSTAASGATGSTASGTTAGGGRNHEDHDD